MGSKAPQPAPPGPRGIPSPPPPPRKEFAQAADARHRRQSKAIMEAINKLPPAPGEASIDLRHLGNTPPKRKTLRRKLQRRKVKESKHHETIIPAFSFEEFSANLLPEETAEDAQFLRLLLNTEVRSGAPEAYATVGEMIITYGAIVSNIVQDEMAHPADRKRARRLIRVLGAAMLELLEEG